MLLTRPARTVAGLAVLAVALGTTALPASAASPGDVDVSALQRFAADHQPGRFTAADLDDEDDAIDVIEAVADVACLGQSSFAPNADLILFDFEESAVGPAVFLVSADVNQDADDDYDATCNFAVLDLPEGGSYEGSYSLTVTSEVPESGTVSLDPPQTFTGSGSLDSGVTPTLPVFTTVTEYAVATLALTGNKLVPGTQTVTEQVKTSKTTAQKKSARKAYDKKVASAKKSYQKSAKSSKAKKLYAKRIASAKRAFRAAIAPTVRTVTSTKSIVTKTPFTLNGLLDGDDDVLGVS